MSTNYNYFQLISIVGSVLDRPKIKEEFTNKYCDILKLLEDEITMCEGIYQKQMNTLDEMGYVITTRNIVPVTSAFQWGNQLKSRVSAPFKSFLSLQHS